MDWSTGDVAKIKALQKKLADYGYKFEQTGKYDRETRLVVEAFNRHFSPEVFVKETVKDGKIVQVESNQKWYALSEERLSYLMAHQ